MVEVLKRKKRADKKVKFTCMGCDADLRASASEGEHASDRDGDAYIFKCPDCGRPNWIDASLVR